ncbi:DUF5302 domain-containing protein [Georgenia sp. Z1491]|uniref:DUF5302 domain-containing protein n=1 Tax=Georgenia sp. Z1491 TaxID=3416707 RepID=UPI003CF65CA5
MSDQDSQPTTEDVKAKMREALERKKARGGASHGDGGHGEGKAHDVAAPDLKRTFRRKSG